MDFLQEELCNVSGIMKEVDERNFSIFSCDCVRVFSVFHFACVISSLMWFLYYKYVFKRNLQNPGGGVGVGGLSN